MSTVRDVMARLYRTYLYPPDFQPPTNFVVSYTDDTPSPGFATVVLGEWAVADDENLLRQGAIIEIGQQLMLVRESDDQTLTLVVLKGAYGTPTDQVPAVNDPVILSPPYARYSVFQAVGDNIITLSPRLYTVSAQNLVEVTGGIAGVGDELALSVESVWQGDFSKSPDVTA